MTDSRRSRLRLPHWGWFLLATIVLVVGFVGLSVWLPWHREQQVIRQIDSWGSYRYGISRFDPEWLQRLIDGRKVSGFLALERVTSVNLAQTPVTDLDLAHLSELKELRYLGLHGLAVTDNGLVHLSNLANLKELDLSRTKVTNAGLSNLEGLKNLERLDLENTKMTDKGLVHLTKMTNLKLLILKGTSVSVKGAKELKSILPHCEIIAGSDVWRRHDPRRRI